MVLVTVKYFAEIFFRITHFYVVMLVFVVSSGYLVPKTVLFGYDSTLILQTLVVILSLFFLCLETLFWSMISKGAPCRLVPNQPKLPRHPTFLKRPYIGSFRDEPVQKEDQKIYHHKGNYGAINEDDFESAHEYSGDEEEKPNEQSPRLRLDVEYTSEETELLFVLQQRYPQFRTNKLYAFLIARNRNLDDTIDMLEKHVEWRKKYKVDDLVLNKCPVPIRGFFVHPDSNGEEAPEQIRPLLQFGGGSIHRFAKNGQPLGIVRAGHIDVKRALYNLEIETAKSLVTCVDFSTKNEKKKKSINELGFRICHQDFGT